MVLLLCGLSPASRISERRPRRSRAAELGVIFEERKLWTKAPTAAGTDWDDPKSRYFRTIRGLARINRRKNQAITVYLWNMDFMEAKPVSAAEFVDKLEEFILQSITETKALKVPVPKAWLLHPVWFERTSTLIREYIDSGNPDKVMAKYNILIPLPPGSSMIDFTDKMRSFNFMSENSLGQYTPQTISDVKIQAFWESSAQE